MKTKLSILFLALLLPSLAQTAPISCTSPLTLLSMSNTGDVYVTLGGTQPVNINVICNTVTKGSFSTAPVVCKQMYAGLIAARIAQKNVTIYYNDSNITSCSDVKPWSIQPTFYFFEIRD